MGANPLGGYLREDIQHIDHGLSHAQRAVEGTDFGQHMGRVGALLSSCFQPSSIPTPLQEQIQQTLLRLALHEA